jgi:hypothetical protein
MGDLENRLLLAFPGPKTPVTKKKQLNGAVNPIKGSYLFRI